MSTIREFIEFAERQPAAYDSAVKVAAKRPRKAASPGEVFYPAADVEAVDDPAEFKRLESAAIRQAIRDGRAGYLASKLDEVRDAYEALRQAAEEAVEGKRYLGQGPLIRLETATSALQEWVDADNEPAGDRPDVVAAVRPEKMAPAGGSPRAAADDVRNHSVDYRSVRWDGKQYGFTVNQARCVKLLWESMKQGTPDVAGTTLRDVAEINSERFDLVFRGHPAWLIMIVAGATKGTYRLADEGSTATPQKGASAKKLSRGAKKRA